MFLYFLYSFGVPVSKSLVWNPKIFRQTTSTLLEEFQFPLELDWNYVC